jgi:hypothetical protein
MSQQSADRTLITTSQTALSDAITELGSAERAATALEPASAAEAAAQKVTLREIRQATDAVLAAQRAVATNAASALPALRTSTKDLTALSDKLQKAEERQ